MNKKMVAVELAAGSSGCAAASAVAGSVLKKQIEIKNNSKIRLLSLAAAAFYFSHKSIVSIYAEANKMIINSNIKVCKTT